MLLELLFFLAYKKVIAAYRQLAYVIPTDYVDEYVCIGESTAIECLRRYVRAVCKVFDEQYLRLPNEDDIVRLLNIAEQREFSGMLGSIDYMYWK
jgi:hypothetical protein